LDRRAARCPAAPRAGAWRRSRPHAVGRVDVQRGWLRPLRTPGPDCRPPHRWRAV